MTRAKAAPQKIPSKVVTKKRAPGSPAPREPADYARTEVHTDINRLNFQTIVRAISIETGRVRNIDIKYTSQALLATQQAVEHFAADLFHEAQVVANARYKSNGVVTAMDIKVAARVLLREM